MDLTDEEAAVMSDRFDRLVERPNQTRNERVARLMGWYQPEDEEGLWCQPDNPTTRRLPYFVNDPAGTAYLIKWLNAQGLEWGVRFTPRGNGTMSVVASIELHEQDRQGCAAQGNSLGHALVKLIIFYLTGEGDKPSLEAVEKKEE